MTDVLVLLMCGCGAVVVEVGGGGVLTKKKVAGDMSIRLRARSGASEFDAGENMALLYGPTDS